MKLVNLDGFITKKLVTIHGHMNAKKTKPVQVPLLFLGDPFQHHPHSYAQVFMSPQPKPCMYLFSPPHKPHAPPI